MGKAYLYICSTSYHLYITLLKQFELCRKNVDLVICDDIVEGKKITARIKSLNLFRNVWFVEQSLLPDWVAKNRFERIFFQHRKRRKLIKPYIPFKIYTYRHIYIFHDDIALGRYLVDSYKRYHLIEDSYNFFQRLYETPQVRCLRTQSRYYKIARLLNIGYFPLGHSILLKDVEVNENKHLQIPCKKIVETPRKLLRERLTPKDLQTLSYIFDYEHSLDIDNVALILTEPLYLEQKCNTQDEQLSIYKYVCEHFMTKGCNVLLKPHPRDQIDYSSLDVIILKQCVPIELMFDLGVKDINCLFSISSSTSFSLPAKHKYTINNQEIVEITINPIAT